MTVFKTFLKVLNKYKLTVILYSSILVLFAVFNMKTSDTSTMFVASKPDVLIVNADEEKGITKLLIDYFREKANIINVEETEEKIDDALFYRDVNYVIYIPKSYNTDFLNHRNPEINIKSTKDYQASLAELMLEKFLNVANTYNDFNVNENELIKLIQDTLNEESDIKITSKLDTDSLNEATYYFNFSSYALMAGAIQVICLIMLCFNQKNIKKRTIISSVDYKKHNLILLLSNALFSIILWLIYVIISFILVNKAMYSIHGILYIINSLVFTFVTVAIAFFISNLVNDKNAINGIVNCVALGSAFLCGAFVPQEMLPTSVLGIAHILPAYWFVSNNDLIKTMEIINISTLKPYLINIFVLIIFIIIFVVLTNIVSKKKQKFS